MVIHYSFRKCIQCMSGINLSQIPTISAFYFQILITLCVLWYICLERPFHVNNPTPYNIQNSKHCPGYILIWKCKYHLLQDIKIYSTFLVVHPGVVVRERASPIIQRNHFNSRWPKVESVAVSTCSAGHCASQLGESTISRYPTTRILNPGKPAKLQVSKIGCSNSNWYCKKQVKLHGQAIQGNLIFRTCAADYMKAASGKRSISVACFELLDSDLSCSATGFPK